MRYGLHQLNSIRWAPRPVASSRSAYGIRQDASTGKALRTTSIEQHPLSPSPTTTSLPHRNNLLSSGGALRDGSLRKGACNCGSNFSAPSLSRFFGYFLIGIRKYRPRQGRNPATCCAVREDHSAPCVNGRCSPLQTNPNAARIFLFRKNILYFL